MHCAKETETKGREEKRREKGGPPSSPGDDRLRLWDTLVMDGEGRGFLRGGGAPAQFQGRALPQGASSLAIHSPNEVPPL